MAEIHITRRGGVAIVTIDNPPVNALSTPVRSGLIEAIREIEADASVQAAVIAATGRTFVAGADMREMERPLEAPQLPEAMQALARCSKPLVAAIQGAALGGGLELALCCRARVAARDAGIGFPEVKIGLIPGSGGTQRLLRMTDFATAVRLVTSGRLVPAAEALELGLIHMIAPGDVLEAAVALAGGLALDADPLTFPTVEAIEERAAARPAQADIAGLRAEILKAAKGQAAPVAAFDLMLLTSKAAFDLGVQEERSVFVYLRGTQEAKALRRLFLAEREAGRPPELKDVPARPVNAAGVIGGGLMGCGIAYAALAAGCRVVLAESDAEAMARGQARMAELLDGAAKSGRLTAERRKAMEQALTWTTDRTAFTGCDLVIEAIYENLELKQELLRQAEEIVAPHCLIASNTSYLDLNAVGAGLNDRSRFLGLHFFSPAQVMRLLEVVRGAETSPAALAAGIAFARRIGKLPIVTGVCEGFCGNRILKAYRIVAETMVEDGASPYEIDAAMTEFGFPMGPFAVQDMAGLEIAYANRKLKPAMRADGRQLRLVELLVEKGRLGRKSGKGWYRYPEGARTGEPDPDLPPMIEVYRTKSEIPHRAFSRKGILEALLAAMRSEGEAILKEGIVARPEDIDLVMVHGYGFPASKGGPMFAG